MLHGIPFRCVGRIVFNPDLDPNLIYIARSFNPILLWKQKLDM